VNLPFTKPHLFCQEHQNMTIKILLDTDIGSDIDDAVCLAYLLAHPQCELLGITTVTGEPVKRAQMASALCKAAGKEIPIFPGCPKPILIEQLQPTCPQAEALAGMDYRRDFPQGQAIEFLRRTVREHPGEITLLTIGPLTNIGLLFTLDPEIPSLLKSWVGMIGVFTNKVGGVGPNEWNSRLDPHAAAICYRARPPLQRSIGLEVTSQVWLTQEEVRRRFKGPLLGPVLAFAETWFHSYPEGTTFHDPLAAATLFNPDICRFERGLADVELESSRLAGLIHWKPDPENGPHEAAVSVDAKLFFEEYFSVF
jgi:purine nucleosidase